MALMPVSNVGRMDAPATAKTRQPEMTVATALSRRTVTCWHSGENLVAALCKSFLYLFVCLFVVFVAVVFAAHYFEIEFQFAE
jgi:hypothetical protein